MRRVVSIDCATWFVVWQCVDVSFLKIKTETQHLNYSNGLTNTETS